MKPRPGRHVKVHVRVVHPMHAPERRHRVKHQVHQIHRQIERQQRPQECQRVRYGKHVRRPVPRSSANTATPTAAEGKNTRTRRTLIMAIEMLWVQRTGFETPSTRLGANNSHAAISPNMPRKNASRITGSLLSRNASKDMAPSQRPVGLAPGSQSGYNPRYTIVQVND